MRKRLEHPFFDALDTIIKKDAFKALSHDGPFPKAQLFKALKEAHPVVYDQKCTEGAMEIAGLDGGDYVKKMQMDSTFLDEFESDIYKRASRVEEFSLPHATSLYLLTNSPTIIRKGKDGVFTYKRLAYLLKEITPERIMIYDFMLAKIPEIGYFPIPDFYEIDLTKFDRNFSSDVVAIERLSNMLSVKRIGIEAGGIRTIKTKGFGVGYVTIKCDNIMHIADKREYKYIKPLTGEVDVRWVGWRRAHWRAFYVEAGVALDSLGRNLVDYTRTGKNRKGEYCVKGYTWVSEHDGLLEEIKPRYVNK